MSIFTRFKEWRKKRYWKKRHLEYIQLVIKDDLRWLSVHPAGKILLERYEKLVSDDWYKHDYEGIGYLRRRLGWDPHQNKQG